MQTTGRPYWTTRQPYRTTSQPYWPARQPYRTTSQPYLTTSQPGQPLLTWRGPYKFYIPNNRYKIGYYYLPKESAYRDSNPEQIRRPRELQTIQRNLRRYLMEEDECNSATDPCDIYVRDSRERARDKGKACLLKAICLREYETNDFIKILAKDIKGFTIKKGPTRSKDSNWELYEFYGEVPPFEPGSPEYRDTSRWRRPQKFFQIDPEH